MREIKRYKLSVAKQMSRGHEIYSVGNIVNNYVISLVTDSNQTYHGDYFEMYRNIESLCCTTGTNIVLQVNYTSKANKYTRKPVEKEIRFVVTRGRGGVEGGIG